MKPVGESLIWKGFILISGDGHLKKIRWLGIALVAALFVPALSGCKSCFSTKQGMSRNTLVTVGELDTETEKRIMQALTDKIADEADEYEITADDLSNLRIERHIFVNDCIVVSIEVQMIRMLGCGLEL
jgi:hypothetical protein